MYKKLISTREIKQNHTVLLIIYIVFLLFSFDHDHTESVASHRTQPDSFLVNVILPLRSSSVSGAIM